MIEFQQPGFLAALLALIPLVWIFCYSKKAETSASASALVLRSLQLGLLIVALADPYLILESKVRGIVAVVDRSPSIQGAGDGGGVSEAEDFLENLPMEPDGESEIPIVYYGGAGDAAKDAMSAMSLASAYLPDSGGRILFFSDGNWDGPQPDPQKSLPEETPIDTFPLAVFPGPEAGIIGIFAPSGLREGEPFSLSGRIFSSAPQQVLLRLFLNGVLEAEKSFDLQSGINEVQFDSLLAPSALLLGDLQMEAVADTFEANNRARLLVPVGGVPRVLVVDSKPDSMKPFERVLTTIGFEVQIVSTDALNRIASLLPGTDLLVLSDVPVSSLAPGVAGQIGAWVSESGAGLLVAGGENAYGAGGYAGSDLEGLLPLSSSQVDREDQSVAALLFILDVSGSMSAPAGNRTKMSLAAEGAAKALNLLGAGDYFGALAVDAATRTILPLSKYEDRVHAQRKLMETGVGGGGIYIYPALLEAWQQLRGSPARIKHAVVFGDASDIEEKFQGETSGKNSGPSALDLATAMLGSGITISVVALGKETDKDVGWLRELVERGRGEFYLTGDATELPQIFAREAMRAANSSLVEDPFFARPTSAGSAIFAPVDWESAPPLLGCNQSRLKPGAFLWLEGPEGLPLLAGWRLGLGQVAAFTSDLKSRWAAEWMTWKDWPDFVDLLSRRLLRRGTAAGEEMEVQISRKSPGELELTIRKMDREGSPSSGAAPALSVSTSAGEVSPLPLQQIGPGFFRANIPIPGDPLLFTALDPENPASAVRTAWSPPPSNEFVSTVPDSNALRSLSLQTGGRFSPSPEETAASAFVTGPVSKMLAPWLFGLCAFLLVVEVAVRRFSVGANDSISK